MNLLDFIGFLFTFLFFIFLIFRNTFKKIPNDEEASEHEKRLKEFLHSLDEDMKEEKAHPLPPPKKIEIKEVKPTQKNEEILQPIPDANYLKRPIGTGYSSESILSQHFQDLEKKSSHYEVISSNEISRGKGLLTRLKSKKELIILNEIISKPISLR